MEGVKLASDSIFATIQGEGKLTGIPSIFVRLAGCNLHCTWNSDSSKPIECDTAYAAYRVENSSTLSIQNILKTISELRGAINHIVITGGEPLLQADSLSKLCLELKKEGFHITIETNGTIYNSSLFELVDLFSISPKLSSSTPKDSNAALRHNKLRINIEALTNLINHAKSGCKDIQLKFVVIKPKDIEEIEKIIAQLPKVEPSNILIMAAGSDNGTLNQNTMQVLDMIIERGWRFCDRLHIRLFGNTPGK